MDAAGKVRACRDSRTNGLHTRSCPRIAKEIVCGHVRCLSKISSVSWVGAQSPSQRLIQHPTRGVGFLSVSRSNAFHALALGSMSSRGFRVMLLGSPDASDTRPGAPVA